MIPLRTIVERLLHWTKLPLQNEIRLDERRRFANVEFPPNFLINHYHIPSIARISKAHRLPRISLATAFKSDDAPAIFTDRCSTRREGFGRHPDSG